MNEIYIMAKDLSDGLRKKYFRSHDIISIYELIEALEDAYFEISELEDEFKEFKEDVDRNYQPITNNDWEED